MHQIYAPKRFYIDLSDHPMTAAALADETARRGKEDPREVAVELLRERLLELVSQRDPHQAIEQVFAIP